MDEHEYAKMVMHTIESNRKIGDGIQFKTKKRYFAFESYERWAIKEVNRLFSIHPEVSPIVLVEDFRAKMDEFACRAKTGNASIMFSVAYDTATDILNHLLGYYSNQDVYEKEDKGNEQSIKM